MMFKRYGVVNVEIFSKEVWDHPIMDNRTSSYCYTLLAITILRIGYDGTFPCR